ncbi:MAG: rhomboid family intramembrane serine protease [Chitinophagales bacterium]
MNFRIDTRSAVFNLIVLNLFVYLLVAFVPISIKGMPLMDALSLYYPASPFFMPHQLLTHLVTHASIGHLFFNMFNLFIFGNLLERFWGGQRLLLFFFITGIGGALLYLLAQGVQIYMACGTFWPHVAEHDVISETLSVQLVSSCLGASGAVFAMLTAAAVLFGNTEFYIYGVFPLPLKYIAAGMIVLELVSQLDHKSDHIAHLAHLSGALMGYIIVKIWNRDRSNFY